MKSIYLCAAATIQITLGCAETSHDGSPDVTGDALETSDARDTQADDAAIDDADSRPSDAPYTVGYRTDTLTYTPPDGSGERTLRVAYWYPTEATTGAAVSYLGLLPSAVLGDAPPAPLGPRPVVVFSHGNAAFAEQSYFFTEHLASRGYLVAAMDHTTNTFGADVDVRIFHWRPEDVSAVIDHLQEDAHALHPLVGAAIAVAGHSFGGYTALATVGADWDVDGVLAYCVDNELIFEGCAEIDANAALYRAGFLDARIAVAIAMAPGLVPVFGQGIAEVDVPTLLVTGARDNTTRNIDNGDPAWTQLATSAANRRIDFANAGHFTFSDACALPVAIGEDDGCSPDFIAPEAAHAAVNAYALAFLRRHLEGDESGADLLDGETQIEPDVTLSQGAQ